MKRRKTRSWLLRGVIVTALLVPLLLWLSGCCWFSAPPEASFTSATIVEIGEAVAFSAILSSAGPGRIIAKFEWSFGDGASASGESVTHTYAAVGQYTVVLRVTDDCDKTSTAQKLITVNPADGDGGGEGPGPTATFTATPLTGQSPLTVTFNASASYYTGYAITAYFWDFGDGTTGAGMTTVHTYGPTVTTSCNVVLRIIASDNTEDTATKTITVTVTPVTPPTNAPTASFTTAPNKVVAPRKIICDGGNSAAAAGRTLEEWIWRFGDGTSPQSVNTDDPIEHRYTTDRASETFVISLHVIDDEDGWDIEQRSVIVENKQPVAGFEIYDVADVVPPAGGGTWVADDVTFPGTGDPAIQTDSATVWIRSEAPTGMQGATPAPNDGTQDDPDPRTNEPTNYGDGDPGGNREHDLSYDPEGQGWDAGTPFGFPSVAWGIEWYKIDWGDGSGTQYVLYTAGPGLLQLGHTYGSLVIGANTFTITVTVEDFLGAQTSYEREVRINRTT